MRGWSVGGMEGGRRGVDLRKSCSSVELASAINHNSIGRCRWLARSFLASGKSPADPYAIFVLLISSSRWCSTVSFSFLRPQTSVLQRQPTQERFFKASQTAWKHIKRILSECRNRVWRRRTHEELAPKSEGGGQSWSIYFWKSLLSW